MPDFEITTMEGLQVLIVLPEHIAEASPPLLCFLHGYDEGPPTEIRTGVTRHGPLHPGNPPIAHGFLTVAPQLPERGDIWGHFAEQVAEIMRQVQRMHDCDISRTYLTGFSFGGNGVFDLALRNPEIWAALWPVEATRLPPADPGLPVWLSAGEVSRRGRTSFILKLGLKPPASGPEQDRVYSDDELDHVSTATAAYRNRHIYEWLLAKRSTAQ